MTIPSSLKIALCCASLALVGASPHALIGTWRAKSGRMTLEMVFTPDHKVSFDVQIDPSLGPSPTFGTWRLEGDQLFLQWHPDNGPLKAPIAKLSHTTLIVTLGDGKKHIFRKRTQ
jgi:hypothetical protein